MNQQKLLDILTGVDNRIAVLEEQLANPAVISDVNLMRKTSREYKKLNELIGFRERYRELIKQIAEDKELAGSDDTEIAQIIADELPKLQDEREKLEQKILSHLVPSDPSDGRPVIVEIRAGTGGNEAALFAGELFRMYSRYAEEHSWKIEVIDSNETELGGVKEIIFVITAADVYEKMRFESGVHRVQRVPVTESGGRIHTSAASVAVLPEVPQEEIDIRTDDLKIDTYRASGAGGQHVNKTDSAVRITHIPTGIVVTCQAERSQHKNRAMAMRILKSKIAELTRAEHAQKTASKRKIQVGSGDRSEKIRTYNFPQNRITDHRIGYTAYNLNYAIDGVLDELFDALQAAWAEDILSEL